MMSLLERLQRVQRLQPAEQNGPPSAPADGIPAAPPAATDLAAAPAPEDAEARFYFLKRRLFGAVMQGIEPRTVYEGNEVILRTRVDEFINNFVEREHLVITPAERAALTNDFLDELLGLGPLEALLNEPTVERILVNGSTEVLVERNGRLELSGRQFCDEAHLLRVMRRIADAIGGRIDEKNPHLDREVGVGARVRAKLPPLAPTPTLTLEKKGVNPFIALKRQKSERERSQVAPYLMLKQRVQQRLVQELDQSAIQHLPPEELREAIGRMVTAVRTAEGLFMSNAEQMQLTSELLHEILGLGPIEPLLDDPEVDEIMVNGPSQVYVERHGRLELTDIKFRDSRHIMQVIERIAAPLGRRIDVRVPMVDGRLPNGSRVHAIIPPLSLIGPVLTIRKFAPQPFTMADLINMGTLSREAALFLQAAVEGSLNIIVSGGTGSGKTTTLNVLSSFIPADERIITIEDAAELQLRQEHVVSLEARPPNIESVGEVTIRELVRQALRMRPDRIIVGECRGGEALDMLQAMNTGHDGSLTTAHANNPRELLSRLETMVLMAGMELPLRAVREQIAGAINLIVHQSRLRDGTRRVTHITELTGMEGDVITMQDIFVFHPEGADERGTIVGRLRSSGIRPRSYNRIVEAGVPLPFGIFKP